MLAAIMLAIRAAGWIRDRDRSQSAKQTRQGRLYVGEDDEYVIYGVSSVLSAPSVLLQGQNPRVWPSILLALSGIVYAYCPPSSLPRLFRLGLTRGTLPSH